MVANTNSKIVIIGAGCFGLSTAYHLLRRGFTSVTVLDRSPVLPAPDAASTDLNKIVRSAYADIFYSKLAREAIAEWKDFEEWKDTYHESGVVVIGWGQETYADKAYENDVALGARIETLAEPAAIRARFPADVKTASFEGMSGYLNRDGGWAFAAQGIQLLLSKVNALGGTVVPSKSVVKLLQREGKTHGVECADGSSYEADLVVIASGSWTASAFPDLDLGAKCLATGQSVVMVQLSPEEGEKYRKCPVFLDLHSGFYIFPPNVDNLVKMAIHTGGHTYTQTPLGNPDHAPISTPRTALSHGDQGLRIPKEVIQNLRDNLRAVYPELAEKPFSQTRLCWYTDSPDEDWIISVHPKDSGLVLATSGSGHAYKFLPNIGRLVVDLIQGKMEPSLVQKFALDRQMVVHDIFRPGQTARELDVDELCTPEDLLP
ncbi:unnamed protein product [Somion occarium]|uniref:FAD dependent oxidoreductase domain-containing protein n=1 Tax=Somion occarium TaxID=3059160 RepID=A0ABP1DWU4_9APHY